MESQFRMKKLLKVHFRLMLSVISLVASIHISAQAEVFPARQGNDDVIMIHDFHTDLQIRIDAVNNAKHTIDIVSHVHTAGPYGIALTQALRKAMERGVRVRYLFEKIANMAVGDAFDQTARMLTDINLSPSGSEIMINRPMERLRSPFSMSQLFHQKIFIVDAETQNEVIISGGRNHDDTSVRNVDLSFVVRPLDPTQKYIGSDIKLHFQQIWDLSSKYFSKEKWTHLKKKDVELLKAAETNPLKIKLSSENQEVVAAVRRPVYTRSSMISSQFRPQFSRLVTNDVLKNIAAKKENATLFNKGPAIELDDITKYISGHIENAYNVELSSYLLLMPERLSDAFKKLVRGGGSLKIFTNGTDAYKVVLPYLNLGAIASSYNYEIIKSFKNENSEADIQLSEIVPSVAKENNLLTTFSHRKMLLVESKDPTGQVRKLSWVGSSNFTKGSSVSVDEMGIMFTDPRMHKFLSDMSAKDNQSVAVRVSSEVVCADCSNMQKVKRNLCRKVFESVF